MNPITECNRCSDCAIRLGFGFTQPDVLICTVRGDEVDVSGRVGYGTEVLD